MSERVTQPSPDVAQMRQYADCPVSYATGSASFSVPLVSLSTPSCGVSLGLTYRCEAKKVTETAGYVGLGWTLTGLGSVSRQICGMPDDCTTAPLDFRDSNIDADYLNALLDYKADAMPDRYTIVTPDGEAVSFLLYDREIKLLGFTELTIVYKPGKDCVADAFTVTTPEGMKYEYTEKEYIEQNYKSIIQHTNMLYQDYKAVSAWHLTKIVAPEKSDSILISYSPGTSWNNSRGSSLYEQKVTWTKANTIATAPNGEFKTNAVSPYWITYYRNPPLPKTISASTGSIEFTFEKGKIEDSSLNGTADVLRAIELLSPTGKSIRKVEFSSTSERRLLTGVQISGADGGVLEAYDYVYYGMYSTLGEGDIFGYPNGYSRSGAKSSILNEKLQINDSRKVNIGHIKDHLLYSIKSNMGELTEFNYEPAYARTSPLMGNFDDLWGDSIVVGTRISSIVTNDLGTGRVRVREFKYSQGTTNMDIRNFYYDDFLAPSGQCDKDIMNSGQYQNFSLSVTFTSTSRRPGKAFDSMKAYYECVEELLWGDGIDEPVKTRYEYDLSHCMNQMEPCGSSTAHYYPESNSNIVLGIKGFPPNTMQDTEQSRFFTIFSCSSATMTYRDIYGGEPMLTGKTRYAFNTAKGIYEPRISETYHYYVEYSVQSVARCYDNRSFRVMENMTAIYNPRPVSKEHISFSDLNADIKRIVCTGKKTTRHYDDGKSREMAEDYVYNGRNQEKPVGNIPLIYLNGYNPGFYGDSLRNVGWNHVYFRPRGVTYSCNGDSLTRYDLYSNDVKSTIFSGRGLGYLPVARKWVAHGADYRDSIESVVHYGRFGGLTRPVMEAVRRHGAVLDSVAYTAYNSLGLPTASRRRDGTAFGYAWTGYGELQQKYAVGDEARTRVKYTHLPLIGCNSITYPSGRKKSFDYADGRVSAVRNTAGDITERYSYKFFGTDAENSITKTKVTASGEAASRTEYDGYGMPVAEVAVGFGGDGGDVATRTGYDVLDRPVRQWQPLPADDSGYYGDRRPYTDHIYDHDGSMNIISTTAPGEDHEGHAATARYICNTASGELAARRLRIEGDRLVCSGCHPAATLDVVRATDADGHTTLSFSDWRGRTVLTRKVLADGKYIDTYTLYNLWGDVALVLQPMGAAKLGDGSYDISDGNMDALIEEYAYVYRYDDALRPVYAKMPGAAPVTTVYDPDGLVAFTSDGNLRADGKCRFNLYDRLARPVLTGVCDGPAAATGRMRARYDSSAAGLDSTGYVSDIALAGAEVYTATQCGHQSDTQGQKDLPGSYPMLRYGYSRKPGYILQS